MLLFGQLNLASLSSQKKKNIIEKYDLLEIKVFKIFEYEKNNNKYWDRAILSKQVVNKVFTIAKLLYFGYSLLILFDNTTNYLVYIKIAF